jgi:hypothetical protein
MKIFNAFSNKIFFMNARHASTQESGEYQSMGKR